MDNLKHYFKNIELRNKMLTPELKNLKMALETAFHNNILEAGVITPGYFSYFTPILENFRNQGIISRFHITEEQFSDSYTGKLIKIPVVDLYSNDNSSSTRIFVTPTSFLRELRIDHLLG